MTEDENWDLDNLDDLPEGDDSLVEWWDFDDQAEMVDAVVGDVQFIIESALDARGTSLIALPVRPEALPLLTALADRPIKWKYVTIIPTDDMLVPVSDDRSHVKALAELFLKKGARVLPIATENPDYKLAGGAADARMQDLHWPPDLVWLGMNMDGSTAGIYPGADMEEALSGPAEKRAVGLIADGGDVPFVTITKAAICDARTVIVQIRGLDMQMALEQAIADGKDGGTAIGRVMDDLTVPVDIYVENG